MRAHEVDEKDVRFMEGVVSGGSSGRLRLKPQFLVHRQTRFQQHRPMGGQVFGRADEKTDVRQQVSIGFRAFQRLDGLALPQEVRVVLGERRRRNPVGEGKPAATFQNAERLSHSPPTIGNVKQSLLAYHDIDALVGDGSRHDVAFDDLNLLLKADESRQHVGAPNARRREFDASD